MNKKDITIIIAHYNEDLEWIKPYAKNTIIYHKGDEIGPRFTVKEWIKLPNVGREGETFLHHIISNYNNLSNINIFLQGGVSDHKEDGVVYDDIEEYIKEVETYGFSFKIINFLFRRNPQIKYLGKFHKMIESGNLKRAKLSFSDFYKTIFNKKQPIIIPIFYAANFGVNKKLIKKRDIAFYKKILDFMDKHPNPEEGHYLERLRFQIFNHGLLFKPNIINKIYKSIIAGIKYRFSCLIESIYN